MMATESILNAPRKRKAYQADQAYQAYQADKRLPLGLSQSPPLIRVAIFLRRAGDLTVNEAAFCRVRGFS